MKDKILTILVWSAVLGSLYLYCYNLNANERLDRVQQLYDLGLEKYETGSEKPKKRITGQTCGRTEYTDWPCMDAEGQAKMRRG